MSALNDILGTIAQLLLSVAPRTPPPHPPWHPEARRSNAFDFVMLARRADATHPAYMVAEQQPPSGQALRMVFYDEWFAVALFRSDDALSYRYLVRVDGVWSQRGGGGSGVGGPERHLTASTGAGWSSPVRNPGACASVTVHGTVRPDIARVQVEFDDGHLEDAVVGDGTFAWFYARRPPPRRPPSDHLVRELLGAEPITVIGLGTDGRELARQDLRRPV